MCSKRTTLDFISHSVKPRPSGRKNIFVDKISGAKSERPGLKECLEQLTIGNILVVWRLDRLGRSMTHLVSLVETLKEKKMGFRSLCDGAIDTTVLVG